MSSTSIVNFFDPHNREHLESYIHLKNKGVWPDGFIKDDIYFPVAWQVSLYAKMADCWVNYVLTRTSEG